MVNGQRPARDAPGHTWALRRATLVLAHARNIIPVVGGVYHASHKYILRSNPTRSQC